MHKPPFLLAGIAVELAFHPRAKAIRFSRANKQDPITGEVLKGKGRLDPHELLEAEIVFMADKLAEIITSDYYAFCADLDDVFNGSLPSKRLKQVPGVGMRVYSQLSTYAMHWRPQYPKEVDKLLGFVIAMPVYSCLLAQNLFQSNASILKQIENYCEIPGQHFMIGVSVLKQQLESEMNTALTEAKMLAATYLGSRDKSAPSVVNGMLDKMLLP